MDEEKKYPRVTIILVNYNNYNDTIECIKSLDTVNYPSFNVLVVDNHSPNDSILKLKTYEGNKIHIVDSGKNGGFAFGNNVGIELALKNGADYVLLLNNDTLVTPQFLNELMECFLQKTNVGIATCRIMYNSERTKVWYSGGDIDWNNLRAIHTGINGYEYREDGIEEVGFASGCCMLVSAECIRDIGGLPEEYFMYCEDMDYCVKALSRGYRIMYNSAAVIYHCVSSSGGGAESPFVIEWSNRARRLFYKKYKDKVSPFTRWLVYIKCEIRSIVKIMLGCNRMAALKAYRKSFETIG